MNNDEHSSSIHIQSDSRSQSYISSKKNKKGKTDIYAENVTIIAENIDDVETNHNIETIEYSIPIVILPSSSDSSRVLQIIKEWQESIIFALVTGSSIANRYINIIPTQLSDILLGIGITFLFIFIYKKLVKGNNKPQI